MDTAYYTNDIDVKKVALTAYPNYKGRKFSIKVTNNPIDVRSYWDGGSRNYYTFLRLDNMQIWQVPQQSMYDMKISGANKVQLVPGMICVEHTYFCGKDLGIIIHVHADNAPKRLENNTELTREEKIVLIYTKTYKNTYAGRTNIRFHEATISKGISLEQWNTATISLKEKKMLNNAGAITNEGRNAIGDLREHQI
jgi:hypothetical protein